MTSLNQIKEQLEFITQELDVESASFHFEKNKDGNSFHMVLSNKTKTAKHVWFGENDLEKNIKTEITPEIKEIIESQRWQ